MTTKKASEPRRCAVPGCGAAAFVEVILYDVYPYPDPDVFFEQDYTCPYLCGPHLLANERGADGVREPRTCVRYPYTNRNQAQGFSIYRPLA